MPTLKQQLVFNALSENIRTGNIQTLGEVLIQAGYSPTVATKPKLVTASKGFQEMVDEVLADGDLIDRHKELLNAKKLDHMVFPLGPAEADDQPDDLQEHTTLTDHDIIDMLADVGGTVRRIVHGQTARHVYFWAANDKIRHDALKLAYDLKGKLKPAGDAPTGNTYNTFVQQNNIDPNTPDNKQLVKIMTEAMMAATKRKVIDV